MDKPFKITVTLKDDYTEHVFTVQTTGGECLMEVELLLRMALRAAGFAYTEQKGCILD